MNRKPAPASRIRRCDYTDLSTILYEGAESLETWFGNTEVLGLRKNFTCMKYADELLALQPQAIGNLNIAEIKIYGRLFM